MDCINLIAMQADLTEVDDLEPLFDYRRVQPHNLVFLDGMFYFIFPQ